MQICRLVDSNSVHCSPLPLNYINDKIYSCVQFLSSTSLTQTKKRKYFCEPKLKKKKRMKLVNKQTSETKCCLDSRSDKQGDVLGHSLSVQ